VEVSALNYVRVIKASLLLSYLLSSEALATLPGISMTGLYGNVSSGSTDALIPVMAQDDHLFFISPQGLYHSSSEYSASLGGGYRRLYDQWGILSAYTFADYNHSAKGNDFWFISPGVQRLGDTLDFSANFYLPVSRQRINTGQTFADEVGINDFVSFSGHDQIDQIVDTFESVGIGADTEVGVRLPFLKNNTKLYVGGYYFAPQDNDSILGGSTRVNVPVNRYLSITASEAYDNVQHNVAKIGLTLSLGGRDSGFDDAGDLRQRLLDPVQRRLAAIAGSAHTTEPITTGEEPTGEYEVELSNIWFFSPDGVNFNSNCTADAPCALTQNSVDSLNATSPQANLYAESGQYTQLSAQNNLTLYNGQSLFGRDTGFTAAATNSELPQLIGGLTLTGDNNINHLELLNDGAHSVGVLLNDGAQQVVLNQVTIGSNDNASGTAYRIGVQLGNDNSVLIENSVINAFINQTTGDLVAGIKMDGVSNNTLTVSKTLINVSTTASVTDLAGVFVGNDEGSGKISQNNAVTLKSDTINVAGNNIGREAFGVYLGNYFTDNASVVTQNQITLSHSQINVSGIYGNAFGILLGNFEYMAPPIDNNSVTMKNSTVFVSSNSGNAYGVFDGMFNGDNRLAQNNNLYLSDNQIDVTANRADAYGVELDAFDSSFTLVNNTINATLGSNTGVRRFVYGVNLQGSEDTLNLIGNTIHSNGDNSDGDVLAVGLNEGLYYSSFDNHNTVNARSNTITATVSSDSSSADGVLIQDAGSVVNLNDNIISANNSGRMGSAIGVNIAGDNNQVTLNNNAIQATASGVDTNAMGIAANTSYGYYGSSSNNVISLSGNSILATSTFGSAMGLFDNQASANNNIWNISADNVISATGFFKSCSLYFNGVCIP
jgi:hypothetical protein